MFFDKHSLQISMKKNDNKSKTVTPNATQSKISPVAINEMVRDNIKLLAVAGVSVYAAVTAIHTASEIAINAAPKKH